MHVSHNQEESVINSPKIVNNFWIHHAEVIWSLNSYITNSKTSLIKLKAYTELYIYFKVTQNCDACTWFNTASAMGKFSGEVTNIRIRWWVHWFFFSNTGMWYYKYCEWIAVVPVFEKNNTHLADLWYIFTSPPNFTAKDPAVRRTNFFLQKRQNHEAHKPNLKF